jgi:hypothetical protein
MAAPTVAASAVQGHEPGPALRPPPPADPPGGTAKDEYG